MTPELIIMLLIIDEVVGRAVFALLGQWHIIRFDPCSKIKCKAFVFFVIPLLAKAFHAWLQEDPYRVENEFTYRGFHPYFYHQ